MYFNYLTSPPTREWIRKKKKINKRSGVVFLIMLLADGQIPEDRFCPTCIKLISCNRLDDLSFCFCMISNLEVIDLIESKSIDLVSDGHWQPFSHEGTCVFGAKPVRKLVRLWLIVDQFHCANIMIIFIC